MHCVLWQSHPYVGVKTTNCKIFPWFFTSENHFSLAAINTGRAVKVSAIIIPFVTQCTSAATCGACGYMHSAMLTYGLSNYEISSVGTTIKEHVLKIIKDKLMQCSLLTLGCINNVHVTEVPVLFGMVGELAIETVTFTTGVFVQPPAFFLVIAQLDSAVRTEQHGVTHR